MSESDDSSGVGVRREFERVPDNYEVRPVFRILGSLLTASMAYMYAATALSLLTADHVPAIRCTQTKRRWQLLCELERWLIDGAADELQGPLRAAGCLLFALVLAYATWWLLKPLRTNGRDVNSIRTHSALITRISARHKTTRVLLWGAFLWLIIAGSLAVLAYPHLPRSGAGWAAFIVLGPPLYAMSEAAIEGFWSSRVGRPITPSPAR